MRRVSITMRLTAWYAVFLLLAVALSWLAFSRAAKQVTRGYYRETLESTSQLARDEIVMTESGLDFDANLSSLDAALVSFYDLNGDLIYGRARLDAPFLPGEYRELEDERGDDWAVYDAEITVEGYGRVYLRAYMNTSAAWRIVADVSADILLIMPFIVFIAAFGGYFLSRRALLPVGRIVDTARGIAGAGDLDKRIRPEGARDELYQLAQVFDDMLARLSAAFQREARFTADASHEMRTPVAAILAVSEAALAPATSDHDRVKALEDVRERAKQLGALINALLTLARMDAGRIRLEFEAIDALELARGVAAEANERYSARGVRVEARGEPLEIVCDQTMITRVIMNLTENAYRHSPDGGNIVIELASEGEWALISVTDEGPGVPEDSLPHIFERFYTAGRAREGSGLGLPIAMAIARVHGGDIRVEKAGGRFSRFTLSLPARGNI